MDPQETLRMLIAEYLSGKPDGTTVRDLTESFNEWIWGGGFHPKATVADGYEPSGGTRPWRMVSVFEVSGSYARFAYDDTGDVETCPVYSLKVANR